MIFCYENKIIARHLKYRERRFERDAWESYNILIDSNCMTLDIPFATAAKRLAMFSKHIFCSKLCERFS